MKIQNIIGQTDIDEIKEQNQWARKVATRGGAVKVTSRKEHADWSLVRKYFACTVI